VESRSSVARKLSNGPIAAEQRRRVVALPRVLVVILSFGVISCMSLGASFEDGRRCERDIKTDLGLEAQVGFQEFVNLSGRTARVTVHLKETPSGDMAGLKGRLREIVERDFRSRVDTVEIAF
jgi:hypothetical protein